MSCALRCRGLVKRYDHFRLGPLDLELEPGIVLGYIGPNGSGKTTTMQCVMRLIRADAGEIEIGGRLNDPQDADWKRFVGYVGDRQTFYEGWTGRENLRFFSSFYPRWNNAYAERVAQRLDVPLHQRARELSRGNRVKLALVAALAPEPQLLLLDEPTAGLDPVARSELLEVLFDVVSQDGRSILYSTHILSDIGRLADELAFLHEGKITSRAQKEDLLESWRLISFRYDGPQDDFEAIVHHRSQGTHHQVISKDAERTLRQLSQLGVSHLEQDRLGLDEIAVHIMKEGHYVASD